MGDGVAASVLVTHDHPDHAEGAAALAARFGTGVRHVIDGDLIYTDDGELRVLATPGHTPDHFSFWWPAARAVFCGDLMMGGLDTALVAKPEGDLADYLESLQRLRGLDPAIIYPAHGPAFTDAPAAIQRYLEHREQRLAQVRDALQDGPQADVLVDRVYGAELDVRLRPYAQAAVQAYVDYIRKASQ